MNDTPIFWTFKSNEGTVTETSCIGFDQPDKNPLVKAYELAQDNWYSDAHQDNTYTGAVVQLHGKRLAYGYYDRNCNCIIIERDEIGGIDEPEDREDWQNLFDVTDAHEALKYADRIAERTAELHREDDELHYELYTLGEDWLRNEEERKPNGHICQALAGRHINDTLRAFARRTIREYKEERERILSRLGDMSWITKQNCMNADMPDELISIAF